MNHPMTSIATEEILSRNNVNITGQGESSMLLAHGFGCDQSMWRFISPFLEKDYKVILFDYVGSGKSTLSAYNKERYQTLAGYAQDIIDICDALALKEVIFVGHSVSSIIGIIASQQRPDLFSHMVLICPSPCFLNIGSEYSGGFDKEDLEELINLMDKNYIGWAEYLAPLVMGEPISEALTTELSDSFCSTDPKYSKPFAKATFFSDYRNILPGMQHPCLILQSAKDSLATVEIGEYMAEKIPNSELKIIEAVGHCLHMTKPMAVLEHMDNFLNTSR